MSDKPYRQIFTLTNKVKANKIAKAYFNRFFITFPPKLFPPARLES